MMRRFSVLLAVLMLIISFTACKGNEEETTLKSGWQNPGESDASDDEPEEETTHGTDIANPIPDDEPDIVFSESTAELVGSMYSKIYGTLKIYYQQDYFLLRDEYNETKFTVFANDMDYSETDKNNPPIFVDMNFDGHNDFAVCYASDDFNAYYYCFLWDSANKTYSYYDALSGLSNPVFDQVDDRIISTYKKNSSFVREDVYIFNNNQLQCVQSEEKEYAPDLDTGPEIIDSEAVILENGNSAQISLYSKENTHSKWTCYIEDEDIITLSSETFDDKTYLYDFLLTAVAQGSTTVIFRYETTENKEYVVEKIINVIVDSQGNVEIIVPEEYTEESTTGQATEETTEEQQTTEALTE